MENIVLKGAGNTRDFGGIKSSDGRKIKKHCFIRSAALGSLSRGDMDILKNEYDLRVVVDLRTETERAEKPDKIPSGVKCLHIPIFDEETAGITHAGSTDKREILSHLPNMTELYRGMISNEGSVLRLKQVFGVITAENAGAVLWHCTEGKDRCGLVSALFLLMLDVPKETVYEDYLFTNTAKSKNGQKYYFLIRYLMRNRELAEKVRGLFSAEREYLDAAFDEIEKRYTSVDAFLREGLGVTDEIKQKMKNKYLE